MGGGKQVQLFKTKVDSWLGMLAGTAQPFQRSVSAPQDGGDKAMARAQAHSSPTQHTRHKSAPDCRRLSTQPPNCQQAPSTPPATASAHLDAYSGVSRA